MTRNFKKLHEKLTWISDWTSLDKMYINDHELNEWLWMTQVPWPITKQALNDSRRHSRGTYLFCMVCQGRVHHVLIDFGVSIHNLMTWPLPLKWGDYNLWHSSLDLALGHPCDRVCGRLSSFKALSGGGDSKVKTKTCLQCSHSGS
jgi:hypothetical protein